MAKQKAAKNGRPPRKKRKQGARNLTAASTNNLPLSSRSGKPVIAVHDRERHPNAEQPGVQTETFRMECRSKRSTLIAATVIVGGLISIYWYIGILTKLGNFYTLVFVVPMYAYVFGDVIRWMMRGVRTVELTNAGIRIFLPREQSPVSVDIAEIDSVHVSRTIDGTCVTLLLRGASIRKVLWMEFFSGPRFRIADGGFDKTEFQEFIRRASAAHLASVRQNR